MKAAKTQVAELAQTRFQNMPISIQRTSYTSKKGAFVERLGAFTEQGNLLGLITPDSEADVMEGQQVTIKFALEADGTVGRCGISAADKQLELLLTSLAAVRQLKVVHPDHSFL